MFLPRVESASVERTVQVARGRIQEWQHANVWNLAATDSLPKTIALVPENALDAVEEAGKLSPGTGAELTNAFEFLRRATSKVEVLRDSKMIDPNSLTTHAKTFAAHLQMAEQHFQFALDHLRDSGEGTPDETAEFKQRLKYFTLVRMTSESVSLIISCRESCTEPRRNPSPGRVARKRHHHS